jgi:HPt (histidine-containing phosphotransfer) domain-containing protein
MLFRSTKMAYVEFDADEVMQEFGDASVVCELAGIVRTDLAGYASSLDAAYGAGNLEEVRRIAHAIKGAAGNVAARAVVTLASAIDNGLRAGQTDAAGQTPDLIAACARLEREIGEWLEILGRSSHSAPARSAGH